MQNRLLTLLFIAALLVSSLPAVAAEDQYYLVGKVVVSSGPVSGARHIYLRWDSVEGNLPNDIVELRLARNGELVDQWSTTSVMSPAEIDALYRGVDHQQRKLETITRLNEVASDAGRAFSAAQFAQELHNLINPALQDSTYNPLWAFLGSRADFNIARARYRAWIDKTPVPADGESVVQYELLGANAAGIEARLGYVEIDPATDQQSLGATDLQQIRVTDWRCDLPENSQDHYTVMLDWVVPGAANIADRTATQMYLAGFDLYRTTDNISLSETQPPVRDIAALAAAAQIDERGRPQIDGLEKVNVALIVDSGPRLVDPEWTDARQAHLQRLDGDEQLLPDVPAQNIPREAKWLEARDKLIRAGMRPGDRRAYYLVARDFTGTYGPTTAAIVEVPLMTRPPAPWNVRTFADETSSALNAGADAFTITWDEVSLDNYLKMYQGTRLFCNTIEARTTGVLEYVPRGGDCATSPRNAVRLDVRDYRIYRFENFDIAGRFKDSDGDGVEDSFETPDLDGNDRIDAFERSAGLQCDITAQPANAKNYLVYAQGNGSVTLGRPSILNPNAPPIARMRDVVPAGNRDTVYWYRFVSEANTPLPVGRFSHISAPQRGLFPDRDPPPPPVVNVTRPGEAPQGCKVATAESTSWSFAETVLDDLKDEVTVSCGTQSFSVTAAEIGNPNTTQCQQIAAVCGSQLVQIDVPASSRTGGQACDALNVPLEKGNQFCVSGEVSITPNFVDSFVAAEPGELAAGGAMLDVVPPPPDAGGSYCIAVFQNIEGSVTRLGSTCDAGGLQMTARPGLFCGFAVATDENNNISRTVQFPCLLTPANAKPPSPPQVLRLNVDNAQARFSFRLPAEQVSMTTVRLRHENGNDVSSSLTSIAVIDNEPGASIDSSIAVDSLQASSDTFCLSLMALGLDDGTGAAPQSPWSTERCFTRTASGEDRPDYLPWPAVQGAMEGPSLQAALVEGFYDFEPFLAFKVGASAELVDDGSELSHCWLTPADQAKSPQDFPVYQCWDPAHANFLAFVDPELRFMLYRQRRLQSGPATDWVQVSPMIDYVHFDRQVVQIGDNSQNVWILNDPYFKVVLDQANPATLEILFTDRYPFTVSADADGNQPYEWRYQAVYFDREHRPVRFRVSPWFSEGTL